MSFSPTSDLKDEKLGLERASTPVPTLVRRSDDQSDEKLNSCSPLDAHGDEALKVLARVGPLGEVSKQEVRRLKRKIDLYVLPLLLIIYMIQYLEKGTLSYANALGIKKSIPSLGVGNHFNTAATMFFVGQAVGEFPTIRLLQLFPLRAYVSTNVVLWGVILAASAAVKSYGGLLVTRIFLGMTEATVVPAWVLYTSQWYQRSEQAFRVGLWFAMCGLSQILGGSVAYGIAIHVGRDPSASLKGWQIAFIVFGLWAVVFGALFFVVLPSSPADAWFLTDREKAIHIERLRENEQGIGSKHFDWKQCRAALLDPITLTFSFWTFAANIPNSLATSYGTTLVMGLGYTSTDSLLLVMPLGAIEIVALVGLSYLASITKNKRIFWCLVGHVPGLVGAILMATTNKVPALIGFYLTGAIPIGWTTILALTSTNIAGSSRKNTVTCLQTVAYTIGNIISPQIMTSSTAPRYLPAKIAICIIYGLCMIDFALMWYLFARENRKRDQAKAEAIARGTYAVPKNHEFLDLTDRENPEFRYSL